MKNLILIGFMGSGKSSVGKEISRISGRKLIDTDTYIEKNNIKISDIFRLKGEAYFRELETSLLKELTHEKGLVISTGGGIVTEKNIPLLNKLGKVFYLKISEETAIKRLSEDTERPLLTGDRVEKIKSLMKSRESLYLSAANEIIKADDLTVKELANQVLDLFEF